MREDSAGAGGKAVRVRVTASMSEALPGISMSEEQPGVTKGCR